MCDASVTPSAREVVDRLSRASSLLLLTHLHPDGDGLGSLRALSRSARSAGRRVSLFLPEGAPQRYDFLLHEEEIVPVEAAPAIAAQADAVVVVDTSALAQLTGCEAVLAAAEGRLLVVDHHATGDPLGDARWVDSTACAAGLMTMELIEHLGWSIDSLAAEALATAITSDTGWLRFENTDPRCLRAMAGLLERGVKPDQLYSRLFLQERPQRLALQARALASLKLHQEGRVAVLRITADDFAATGAAPDETENLVNEALRIASVEVAIMLVENPQNIRVNLRSRGRVDVAQLARPFGGGGHARAAGLRGDKPADALEARILAALRPAISPAS